MKFTKRIESANRAYEAAVEELEKYGAEIDELPEDTKDDERDFRKEQYAELETKVAQLREKLEREVSLQKAREASALIVRGVEVGKEPLTYDKTSRNSYFRDLVAVHAPVLGWETNGAEARLAAHGREVAVELRDVTSADPGTGTFIPPLYMGSQWIDEEVAGRPTADACVSIPLPATGKQMDFPRVATAPAVAVQASEAAAVNEVDFDGETYSVSKVLIAGQNDLSIQAYEFADPGMDVVIMRELAKSYNSTLDSQLLSGSGSSGQHRGFRNISGINTVTFSSGNGAALVGKLYEAQSSIATNAPGYAANAIIMHPRRAAWLASHRDTSGTLFQQSAYFVQVGSQDGGFIETAAGLRVIRDANIATTLGSGTNEDEIYVVDMSEIMLAEGNLRARVLTEVLSGTLQVRLQLFAFSAFPGGRRPKVITRVSGAGLATPTFPST